MFSLPKPRVFCGPFQGCRVFGFAGGAAGFGGAGTASVWMSPAAFARAARSASSSFTKWHCLYFFPEPQWHGSLRPSSRRVGSAKVLLRTCKSSVLTQGGHLRTIRDGRCAAPPKTPLARRRRLRGAGALYVGLTLLPDAAGPDQGQAAPPPASPLGNR